MSYGQETFAVAVKVFTTMTEFLDVSGGAAGLSCAKSVRLATANPHASNTILFFMDDLSSNTEFGCQRPPKRLTTQLRFTGESRAVQCVVSPGKVTAGTYKVNREHP